MEATEAYIKTSIEKSLAIMSRLSIMIIIGGIMDCNAMKVVVAND